MLKNMGLGKCYGDSWLIFPTNFLIFFRVYCAINLSYNQANVHDCCYIINNIDRLFDFFELVEVAQVGKALSVD